MRERYWIEWQPYSYGSVVELLQPNSVYEAKSREEVRRVLEELRRDQHQIINVWGVTNITKQFAMRCDAESIDSDHTCCLDAGHPGTHLCSCASSWR